MLQAARPADREQVGAGDNGHKVSFDALLQGAQELQVTIRELLAQTGRIIAGMKAHHRSTRAMRDAVASLRQLGQLQQLDV